jgi:predicted aldo/keto reductase-like oxidoreductase
MAEQSEKTLKNCLTSRYDRESYVLVDKLSSMYFNCREDVREVFEKQLADCGVDYFDIYLMHCQDRGSYKKYKDCGAYEEALKLKAEGKIKAFGISFHDTAELLETILIENPEIEVVQIQFNYLDYDDPCVQSGACYEVCRKYGKRIVVMEPVKGGTLVDLPAAAREELSKVGSGSEASFAIRYAASFDGVMMVLSGMGNMDMVRDNLSYMTDFKPLSDAETEAVKKAAAIYKAQGKISCTACRYCLSLCPQNISIPDIFACYNSKKISGHWNADFYYGVQTEGSGKAGDCIKCGACESICPQHLPIRELLTDASELFDKKN